MLLFGVVKAKDKEAIADELEGLAKLVRDQRFYGITDLNLSILLTEEGEKYHSIAGLAEVFTEVISEQRQ